MLPFLANEAIVNILIVHFLVSVRIMGLLFTASVFLLPSFPNPVKFWLAVGLAVAIMPTLDAEVPMILIGNWVSVFAIAGRELLVGSAIGFISSMPLYAMQFSGFLDSTLMGFNMMNIFDPLSASQVSVLAQMKYMLAVWFYLHWNGHMLLLQALSESLKLVPIGIGSWAGADQVPWTDWIGRAFIIAAKISLPIFGVVLLSEVGLGFVARTVPQMNVFILGIPIKIGVGLIVLLTVLPSSVDIFHSEIEQAVEWALEGIHFWR
ncbi:MAG: flagellar biosynthetic protein FliR [Synergistaceae bacterium]|nr:flagellar biosynthetic protein FliR [Synergistaceae bacterium]